MSTWILSIFKDGNILRDSQKTNFWRFLLCLRGKLEESCKLADADSTLAWSRGLSWLQVVFLSTSIHSSSEFISRLNWDKILEDKWKALSKLKGLSAEIHRSASSSGGAGISPPQHMQAHTYIHCVFLSTFIMENTGSLNYVMVVTRPPPGCEPCAAVKAGTVISVSVRSQINPY